MPTKPMVTVTPDSRGPRALDKLRSALLDTKGVRQNAAVRVLKEAKQNAASRPTPQARMVASGMIARRGTVIGFASRRVFGSGRSTPVKLGVLAYGSEFGSNTHRQFGPRNESGYWLNPAGDEADLDEVLEEHVDDAIDAAIRVSKIGF